MELTREFMLGRMMARDATFDGAFLAGVRTTGIYCRPSCPARKPHAENVEFYRTEADAQAAGLRPCKRCRPDNFYRGLDPDRERLETALSELRAEPARFGSVGDVAKATSTGISKLNALARLHYHTTPAVLLARARVAAAQRALQDGQRAIDAALGAGFESLSAFNESFRRWTGLRPRDWARLGDDDSFALRLPPGYREGPALRVHGRDDESPTERVTGRTIVKVLNIEDQPVRLEIRVTRGIARCIVQAGTKRPGAAIARAAHAAASRMLGLDQDPAQFERRIARLRRTRGLVNGRAGTRVPLTADPFEALVWCIVGQQVNLAFAYSMRRALIAMAGTPASGGMRAHPTPAQVAALDYSDLTAQRYSRRKAEYLIDAARAVHEGTLPLRALGDRPATVVERTLLDVRGLGPWSTNYLMMRGFGFADCVPVGDTGLGTALERFFALDARPDAQAVRTLMQPFAPFRSLATFHLWLSLGDTP
jgi:AraC family transcriptional regulator of adaptative response / DNA-3-methyladenine glycosylase II